jgi:hypothetical protein
MPLSPPAPRQHLHARTLSCHGYLREDGLWEIEGHIVDRRRYAFDNEWRGRVAADQPLHEMWLRLTLDEDLTIRAVEAATDASPFAICPDVVPNFQRLVGAKIGAGFARTVRERLGGPNGCTHLVEMLSQIATVALQTKITQHARNLRREKLGLPPLPPSGGTRSPWADAPAPGARPAVGDTCYAWSSGRDVVRRLLPEHYTGPEARDAAR